MTQAEILLAIAVAIVVLVLVFALKAMSERALLRGGGRLSVDATTPVASGDAKTSTVDDAILANVPEAARPQVQLALDAALTSRAASPVEAKFKFNLNVKTVIKVPTKEMADMVAAREQAHGMEVQIISPEESGDKLWQVTAIKK
jgi:hypothetical protein